MTSPPVAQPWVPRAAHCEFCSRPMHGQFAYVGPTRGQARVLACSGWDGLKTGRVPCAYSWERMDTLLRDYQVVR